MGVGGTILFMWNGQLNIISHIIADMFRLGPTTKCRSAEKGQASSTVLSIISLIFL